MPRRHERRGPDDPDAESGSVDTGWQWVFTPAAARQFAHLDQKVQQRIIDELDLFAAGARVDVRKLEGGDEYRLRVGS